MDENQRRPGARRWLVPRRRKRHTVIAAQRHTLRGGFDTADYSNSDTAVTSLGDRLHVLRWADSVIVERIRRAVAVTGVSSAFVST